MPTEELSSKIPYDDKTLYKGSIPGLLKTSTLSGKNLNYQTVEPYVLPAAIPPIELSQLQSIQLRRAQSQLPSLKTRPSKRIWPMVSAAPKDYPAEIVSSSRRGLVDVQNSISRTFTIYSRDSSSSRDDAKSLTEWKSKSVTRPQYISPKESTTDRSLESRRLDESIATPTPRNTKVQFQSTDSSSTILNVVAGRSLLSRDWSSY